MQPYQSWVADWITSSLIEPAATSVGIPIIDSYYLSLQLVGLATHIDPGIEVAIPR